MKRFGTYIAALFTILLISCSSGGNIELPEHISSLDNLTVYPAVEEGEVHSSFTLVPDHYFGETEEIFLGHIGAVVVADDGRVFITDPGERKIQAYRPDGSHLATLGGEGAGPGEYQNIASMKVYAGRLYIFDSSNSKLDIYSLDSLSLAHTVSLNPENWSDVEELAGRYVNDIFPRSDETFLVRFTEMPTRENEDSKTVRYYLMDREGQLAEPVREVLNQDDMMHRNYETDRFVLFYQPYPPVFRKPLVAAREDGRIYSAWSGEFLIKTYNPEGEYREAFYHPFANQEFDRNAFVSELAGPIGEAARAIELPDTWPALESLLVDDENRFWISTIIDDLELWQWWVLNESGELLDIFEWPRNREIREVKNGYLYTRETNEETGVQQVVRYRIELE
ncbi:MAG: 6-bladed beta-propeller [Balneolaceae bacterium]